MTIYSVSASPERGQLKKEISEGKLVENSGLENDGHAGDWGRQVTCLSLQSVLRSNREHGLSMGPGDFAENILIDGLNASAVPTGKKLSFESGALLEVTQIGKEDHPSVVTRAFGVSLLPYEGLFCRVLRGGTVKKGDAVEIV
jgi:MOSC domain-containing protein YiiM